MQKNYMLTFWGKGNDSGRYIYCYFNCLRLVYPMAIGLLICNFIQTNKLYLQAMFTLYRKAFAPPRKSYRIGLLFTHKNRCGGAISVTKQSCAAPISKVESQIAGLHVTSRRPCWWSRTKAFLSSGN